MFSPKDFVPDSLKSHVVYQFSCASCEARYIGETNRHFNTRVNEHLFKRTWQAKTHCCGHIVAHDVSWAALNWETFVEDTKSF